MFAPHPDDKIFGCGGAIIRHIQQGDEVKIFIVTDGGLPVDESQKVPDYIEIRKKESLAAAEVLGYGKPEFLGYPDGDLQADEELIIRLLKIMEEFLPQNIYLSSEAEIHPDHKALNKAIMAAVVKYPKNVKLFCYEIGQPLLPNFLLDITNLRPTLNQAMECFTSQLAVQDYKTHLHALHTYRSYTLGKDVKLAEAYRLICSDDLKTGSELWLQKQHTEVASPTFSELADEFPLISIIVRTMNRPQLVEALESIAAQTYSNIEVIVVDARGEEPLNLGEKCGRFPLRVISKNIPLSRPAAANAGLDAVNGEYFGFLDDDDLIDQTHISKLCTLLKNQGALVVYSGIKAVDQNGNLLMLYNEDFLIEKLLFENYIPIHALLFQSQTIRQNCRFDERFEVYEDWDFLIQAAMKTKFCHHSEITGVYRNSNTSGVHEASETSIIIRKIILNKWKMQLDDDQYVKFVHFLAGYDQPKILERNRYLMKNREIDEAKKLLNEARHQPAELQNQLYKSKEIVQMITESVSRKLPALFLRFKKVLR